MMTFMRIDVIIPTFNRAPVLMRAIQSVLNQTYQDFTLHIVDDGSTDETASVLLQVQSQPNVVIHRQENRGVSAARNFGVKNSTAPYISFLDSDDEWMPEKLQVQANFLKNSPHLSFLHSEEIWVRNGVRVNPKVKHQKSNENLFTRSLDFCLISPSTVILSRELFLKHNGFDESFTVCEDYDLWLKILASEEIGFIEQPLTIKYGGHEDQLSTKFVAMDYWRIKSLCRLVKEASLSLEQREQVKNVLEKKAAILLKGYVKYQNQSAHDEISALLKDTISYF